MSFYVPDELFYASHSGQEVPPHAYGLERILTLYEVSLLLFVDVVEPDVVGLGLLLG